MRIIKTILLCLILILSTLILFQEKKVTAAEKMMDDADQDRKMSLFICQKCGNLGFSCRVYGNECYTFAPYCFVCDGAAQ